jgi:hypothetical protein
VLALEMEFVASNIRAVVKTETTAIVALSQRGFINEERNKIYFIHYETTILSTTITFNTIISQNCFG